jgi:hypothetical protein
MAQIESVEEFDDDFTEEDIFVEISNERDFQQKIGYSKEVDDSYNGLNDWVTYITRYATIWFPGGFPPYTDNVLQNFRKSMIKTAALAVAAIEWTDRELERRNKNG